MPDIWGELFSNSTIWIAVLSFAVAQMIKICIELKKTKKLNMSLLMSAGGMPSSHTSFVVSMTTAIGYKEGFDSQLFAVSAILSMIVMYDAAGVRRAAGKQAAVINMMVASLANEGITLDKKLKELLGHSPIEVGAGALLGILIAALICSNFII